MIVNLFILFLLIGLTIGAGWLTWRAVRAGRLWVKVAGGLGAGLLTLLLAAISIVGSKGVAALYFPGAPAASSRTTPNDPKRVARGEYLVNISCIGCHSAVNAEGSPTEAQPLNGGWNIAAAEGFGFVGDMVTENLTPGGKLAGYTDGEIFRALRYGVDKDGKLLGFMGLLSFSKLSDDDTDAIVAYLRSLPAVESAATTGDQINFMGVLLYGSGMFPLPEPPAAQISAPPQGVTAEYGKYVATFSDCLGCHGPDATGTPASSFGPAVPNPRPLAGSITTEQFIAMMRSGVRPNSVPFSEAMPWQSASKLTDDDLAALHSYLSAPVK
jgi:mono/diheme cytochrome c family protein